MNSQQRRKLRRKLMRADGPCRFIRDWSELAQVQPTPTHFLKIDVEGCNGWIKRRDGNEVLGRYLSTHTFYGTNYLANTLLLRRYGFNVTLANWDACPQTHHD